MKENEDVPVFTDESRIKPKRITSAIRNAAINLYSRIPHNPSGSGVVVAATHALRVCQEVPNTVQSFGKWSLNAFFCGNYIVVLNSTHTGVVPESPEIFRSDSMFLKLVLFSGMVAIPSTFKMSGVSPSDESSHDVGSEVIA